MKKTTSDKKVTNEKPVTLSPLNFQEAVKALLEVKPIPKEKKIKNKPSK